MRQTSRPKYSYLAAQPQSKTVPAPKYSPSRANRRTSEKPESQTPSGIPRLPETTSSSATPRNLSPIRALSNQPSVATTPLQPDSQITANKDISLSDNLQLNRQDQDKIIHKLSVLDSLINLDLKSTYRPRTSEKKQVSDAPRSVLPSQKQQTFGDETCADCVSNQEVWQPSFQNTPKQPQAIKTHLPQTENVSKVEPRIPKSQAPTPSSFKIERLAITIPDTPKFLVQKGKIQQEVVIQKSIEVSSGAANWLIQKLNKIQAESKRLNDDLLQNFQSFETLLSSHNKVLV